jgi:hypothetical protein
MATTIDLDTAAIKARAYGAATRQAKHFEVLHSHFEQVLAKEQATWGAVAGVLEAVGATGDLSQEGSAAAIHWLRSRLAAQGVPAGKLANAGGSALDPRGVDVFAELSAPADR